MGWTIEDTMSLTPRQVMLIQDSLYDLLRKENGTEDKTIDDKIKKATALEVAKKIEVLKSKGIKKISAEKLFGALGRK